MALDLEQAGGVVGAVAVPTVGQQFADPLEERVKLADDRRELGCKVGEDRCERTDTGFGIRGLFDQRWLKR